ncbi:MAG: hypothetical protein ACMG6S_06005 [Byssovorax sp.]
MEELAARGSAILASVAYSDGLCDSVGRARVREKFSPELKAALVTMKRTTWHPRAMWIEVLRAVVSVHNEPGASHADLIGCGKAICEDAASTFMKLLLKMMTPRLFARKFPDFWVRDMRGGIMSVDPSDLAKNRFVVFLEDVEGFDHVGPAGVGFIGFAMEKITGGHVDIVVSPWSLERPGPAKIRWDVSW